MKSKRTNKQFGGIPFLGILILIALGFLAVGSYFQYQERQALAPSPTPTPYVVTVDKSNPVEGQILVVFKPNTQAEQIAQVFSNANIGDYMQVGSTPFLIYKAKVGEGREEQLITQLKKDSNVSSVTLSYE